MTVKKLNELIPYSCDEAEVYFCNDGENPLEGRKIKGVLKIENLRGDENKVVIVLIGDET